MSDIVEFLRARLDEDEAAAQHLIETLDRSSRGCLSSRLEPGDSGRLLFHGSNLLITATRVLAEVAAKRKVIDNASSMTAYDEGGLMIGFSENILKALTEPHADHPDFDPAWQIHGVSLF